MLRLEQSDLGPYCCNIGYQIILADEQAEDKTLDWREKGLMVN